MAGMTVAEQLQVASRSAVAHFWKLLAGVVAVQAMPLTWLPRLTPMHPFICARASISH